MTDGFLGRWSRRKLDVREGKPVEAAPPSPQLPTGARAGDLGSDRAAAPLTRPEAGESRGEDAADTPVPTLEETQALTPDSDFTPFMARRVVPEVRNAAMKKLFADPHFNVMDRLDIYIDDYSLPDPLPASTLRQMASAQFLKLVDDETTPADPVRDDANSPAGQSVAKSADGTRDVRDNKPPPEASPSPGSGPAGQREPAVNTEDHANTDLRLQQDHAAGAPLTEREPECSPGPAAS